MAVDDGVSQIVAFAPPYSPDISDLQTVTQRNLKSFMGFWNRPEQPESESMAASISNGKPSAASDAMGDMIFGAPRAMALAGPRAAKLCDTADGQARTLTPMDSLNTDMAHIRPVARATSWWESEEGLAAVGKIQRRPDVATPLKWDSVHSELKNQLMHGSEGAMTEHTHRDIGLGASNASGLIAVEDLQHAVIVEEIQRVAGRLAQRLR